MVLIRIAITAARTLHRGATRQYSSNTPTRFHPWVAPTHSGLGVGTTSLKLSKTCHLTPTAYPCTRPLRAPIRTSYFPFNLETFCAGKTLLSAPVRFTSMFGFLTPFALVSSSDPTKGKSSYMPNRDSLFFAAYNLSMENPNFWKNRRDSFRKFGRQGKYNPKPQNEKAKPWDKKGTRRSRHGKCRICQKETVLERHHIISQGHARKTGQLDLITNPGNIVYICRACHDQTTASMVRKRILREKKNNAICREDKFKVKK